MRLRSALVFISVGAIFRFAVTAHLGWINLQTFGLVLICVGIFGLLFTWYKLMLGATRRRREQLASTFVELGEPEAYRSEQPDPTLISEIESAHELAHEARPFLEAEGFSSQRIGELALAYAARDVGNNTEEFIDWALAQGRLGRDPTADV